MLRDTDSFCVSQSLKLFQASSPIPQLMLTSHLPSKAVATVALRGFGNSSFSLANSIKLEGGERLAMVKRTFVRTSGTSGRPLPFTEAERSVLSELVEADESGADNAHFAGVDSGEMSVDESETVVTTLPLSPQHTNFGNHVDHAALLGLACLAQPSGSERPTSYKINYVSQGKLGEDVEVVRLGEGRGAVVRGERGDICRCRFGSYETFEFDIS